MIRTSRGLKRIKLKGNNEFNGLIGRNKNPKHKEPLSELYFLSRQTSGKRPAK